MLLYTLILWGLSFRGGWIGITDGWILLLFLLGYLAIDYAIVRHKKPINSSSLFVPIKPGEWRSQFMRFSFGLLSILIGARLLVKYGIEIARFWHVPEGIISLTIIAMGTSLPELVTAMTAAVKGHENLSIGNILGANILNITLVLGVSALVGPLKVPAQSNIFDIPMALLMGGLLVIPGIIMKAISRIQAFILLITYFIYIWVLFSVFG